MQFKIRVMLISVCLLIIACSGLQPQATPTIIASRQQANPPDIHKTSPEEDLYPPIIHLPDWQQPVPMTGPINTSGAEDSPFITPDGQQFFFFYTPDVRVPPEKQILDGATGIWWTERENGAWLEPRRMVLNDDLALDGCPFVAYGQVWFCSVRKGNQGEINWYTAQLESGVWQDWENAGERLNVDIQVGELHISSDGNTLIYHSDRPDGFGGLDLWIIQKLDSGWSVPQNLGPVINSEQNEGWPYISSDGQELWFTSSSKLGYPGPAIYRSLWQDGSWGEPIEVISNFAGELAKDDAGTLYFTHHFFSAEGEMIEADIYSAELKK